MMRQRIVSKEVARQIVTELDMAANAIFKAHGFEATQARWTYGDIFKATFQSSPVELGKGGVNLNSLEAQDWGAYASLYDLPEDALGDTVRLGGRTFTIVGLNMKARKSPVMLRAEDGKTFKAQTDSVKRALNIAKLTAAGSASKAS